jgi:hypothetical protein
MEIEELKQMVSDMYSEGMFIIPTENNAKKWFSMRMEELVKKLEELNN